MVIVHTSVPIKSEYRDQALAMTKEIAEKSRKENGIINYRAMTDITNPNILRFFEQYEGVETAKAHSQTDYYEEWIEALPDMVDGQLENSQFEINGAPETIHFDIEEAV